MSATASGNPTPVLFYDFNSPPGADGYYLCLGVNSVHHPGQRVIFGCQSDELMYEGIVRRVSSQDGYMLLGIELLFELPCERPKLSAGESKP